MFNETILNKDKDITLVTASSDNLEASKDESTTEVSKLAPEAPDELETAEIPSGNKNTFKVTYVSTDGTETVLPSVNTSDESETPIIDEDCGDGVPLQEELPDSDDLVEDDIESEYPESFANTNDESIEDNPAVVNNSIDDEDTKLTDAEREELVRELEAEMCEDSELPPPNTPPAKPITPEPPVITAADTKYNNKKFGCEPSAFYQYKNAAGITVGYIVRWDIETGSGTTKKEIRPYTYDFSIEKWESKIFGGSIPNSRPLYNLLEIIKNPDKSIMIVEGEKTAEAAKLLFPEFVVTTSCMGAKASKNTDWSYLRGRDIILAPDDGQAGMEYLISVRDELKRIGTRINKLLEPMKLGSYVIQEGTWEGRVGETPKGYDLADAIAEGWTAELILQAQESEEFKPFFKERLALHDELKKNEELFELEQNTFKLTPNGLYLKVVEKATNDEFAGTLQPEKITWMPLCYYLRPTHRVKDNDNSWGMLVKFKDHDNLPIEVFLKRKDLLSERGVVDILQDQGLQVRGLHQYKFGSINGYLNAFKPEIRAVGVDTVGWQNDNSTYMLPFADTPRNSYSCIKAGETPVEYIFQQKGVVTRSLRKKGSLTEWKRTVGEVCKGNHLHTFAILAALAPPALKPLGEEGGFFHYVGNTSIGKSTILHVAKSVWGFENLGSFRITDNGLEDTCKNANDGALFLDEIGEADPDAFFKIVYMLANGVTKTRADRGGNAKATTHFTVLAQSTGEIGLEAKLADKGKKAKGGQLMRMVELDADRGKGLNTFDVLNINPDTGKLFSSGKEQAEYLKTHARENCGWVIDSFLKQIVPNVDEYIKDLKEAKKKWLERKFTGEEGAEVARMAKKFSTVYANGVVAVGAGILPITYEDVEICVDTMFNNWLDRFGGDSSYELKAIIADLRQLVIEHQYDRFCNANPSESEPDILSRKKAGYWHTEKKERWIYPSVFERDVLKGRDRKVFYPLLVDKKYLKGKEGDLKHYAALRKPAKEERQRFMVIDISVLSPEEKG